MHWFRVAAVWMLLALAACRTSSEPSGMAELAEKSMPRGIGALTAPVSGFRVKASYPHDPGAFTQGLVYHDGFLYESTGRQRQSSIRKVELETGKVVDSHELSEEYFGEGLTLFGDRFYQLTWQNGVSFQYDLDLEPAGQLLYGGEGWGLASDATSLIMTDGGPSLSYRDPSNFRELRRTMVRDGGAPVYALNELEIVDEEILANVWGTSLIARIAPATGEVTGWIDLRGLLPEEHRKAADVLNGIAYDPENQRLFVTGKLWPLLFEIELAPPETRKET
ncbi:MAG: glutaminyl-peptide cyclotransferase [Armatimonadetes bacterium]|nr:glutaminyl-peptide cyclotransferase [Armatimonadota bacterium]